MSIDLILAKLQHLTQFFESINSIENIADEVLIHSAAVYKSLVKQLAMVVKHCLLSFLK